MDTISIRRWTPEDSVEEITELLHLAYGALARQGMHYNASHQPPSQTLDRLTKGDSFIAVEAGSGKIVGTISVYRSSPKNWHAYYCRSGLMYFGQFAVHPDFQGKGISKRLYQTVEDHARALGSTEMALDTAETAYDLIAMYRRWGFEIVDSADWDSTNYVSVIMSKPLA
jgi:GNAT superfamily N-acetyltransferase